MAPSTPTVQTVPVSLSLVRAFLKTLLWDEGLDPTAILLVELPYASVKPVQVKAQLVVTVSPGTDPISRRLLRPPLGHSAPTQLQWCSDRGFGSTPLKPGFSAQLWKLVVAQILVVFTPTLGGGGGSRAVVQGHL